MTFKKLALTTILAGGVALPAHAQGLGGADAGVGGDVGGQVGTDGGSVGADVGADVGVGDTGADVGVSADVGTDGSSASADADASASADTGDSDASGSADADDGSGDTDSADAGSDSSDTGSAADSDSADADTGAESDADDGAATASAAADTGASGQGNTEMSQEMKLLLDRPTGVVSSDGVLIGTIYNTRTDPADGSTQAVLEVNSQTGLSPDSLAIEVANLTVQADGTLGFDMTIDSLRDRLASD